MEEERKSQVSHRTSQHTGVQKERDQTIASQGQGSSRENSKKKKNDQEEEGGGGAESHFDRTSYYADVLTAHRSTEVLS